MARQAAQWCDRHWGEVRDTFDGLVPINGIMLGVEMLQVWLQRKYDQLGEAMPGPADTEAINRLLAQTGPLCCWLDEDTVSLLKAKCVLPEKYRGLPARVGHVRHMQEIGGR